MGADPLGPTSNVDEPFVARKNFENSKAASPLPSAANSYRKTDRAKQVTEGDVDNAQYSAGSGWIGCSSKRQ
jgi:hypothetical protein